MSGVWVFRNGVARLVSNPHLEPIDGSEFAAVARKAVLVHVPTGEVVTSYEALEKKLVSLGWERYYNDAEMLQFHKASSIHLITLPKDFSRFKSVHMYDIVVKNRGHFSVKEM